jgi:hypothetical protein
MYYSLPPNPPAVIWCVEAKQAIKDSPVLSQVEKQFLAARLANACAKFR